MKKTLTLTVALALVALGSVSWAATRPKSSRIMQKGGPPPKTDAINLNSSRSNVYRVKVTQVNKENKTFTGEVTFSAAKLAALPKVVDVIDVTYTENPTGGPMEATTINTTKSNTFRAAKATHGETRNEVMTGKVTQVNANNKTFKVEVTFSAAKLKALPTVGAIIDLTENSARIIYSSCEECNAVCPGVCFLGSNGCRCYLIHLSTSPRDLN
jgi:hypothetical protein